MKIDEVNGIDGYNIFRFEGWVYILIIGFGIIYDIDILDEFNGISKVGKMLGE